MNVVPSAAPAMRQVGLDQLDQLDWLEDQVDPRVIAWADMHDRACREHLNASAHYEPLRRRLGQLLRLDQRWLPETRSGVSVELRQRATDERPSLWVTDAHSERCIVDAATLDDDGLTAITSASLSPDGSVLAWGAARAGVDWTTVRFREVSTGVDRDDVLTGIKWAQLAWINSEAVAYLSLAESDDEQDLLALNTSPRVKLHRFGSPPAHDTLLFSPASDTVWALPHTSSDGQWIIVAEQVGIVPARLHVRRVGVTDEGWDTVVDGAGPIHLLDLVDDELICIDFRETPNGQIVAIERQSRRERIVVPEGQVAIDTYAAGVTSGQVVLVRHASEGSRLEAVPLSGGSARALALPESAVVTDLVVDHDAGAVVVETEQAGNRPGTETVRIDVATGVSEVIHRTGVPSDGAVVIETVQATSVDGTEVPLRIIRAAGPRPNGDAKVLLSVYGGYSVPFLLTGYAAWQRAWLELGGVLAYAGIRGGGEYGEAWHDAATKTGKQRGVDDLIACVEWFEVNGWAAPRSVALNGMSNGGMMVATVLTQRPDLLGAALPEVGVFDLLRFHLFTAGHGWVREFGDVEVPEERAALERLSPLHAVATGTPYPPTLVLTADKDDRVPPGPHSYRFFAALTQAQAGPAPLLLRVAHNAGHAAGRTLAERIDERAAVLAFAAEALGLPRPGESSPV